MGGRKRLPLSPTPRRLRAHERLLVSRSEHRNRRRKRPPDRPGLGGLRRVHLRRPGRRVRAPPRRDAVGDAGDVGTAVRPGLSVYDLPGAASVTDAAQPDALLFLVLVEAAREAPLAAELLGAETRSQGGRGRRGVPVDARAVDPRLNRARPHGPPRGRRARGVPPGLPRRPRAGGRPVRGRRGVGGGDRQRGLRLRTPDPALDLAVDFAKAHMQLGYDWRPDGASGGAKMVCDIFRWRDVWSRDFGSGFGPGGSPPTFTTGSSTRSTTRPRATAPTTPAASRSPTTPARAAAPRGSAG